jgi:hypothetical protein
LRVIFRIDASAAGAQIVEITALSVLLTIDFFSVDCHVQSAEEGTGRAACA